MKRQKASPLSASIGIMAYNEERNIARFLDSLLNQKDFHKLIYEIIVVSSGSTDSTNRIVQTYCAKHKKIKLFKQSKRLGKASGVNLFISLAKKNILILTSSDLLLENSTIKNLLTPLRKKDVGITGAHPIPVNSKASFMGKIAHLQWGLHHQIALKKPKMGEMIAFRKIFKQIPSISSVDEANIEPLIRGQGFRGIYCPNAIVYNKGPESIKEFIARRRHIYFGHIVTKHDYGYEVSTLNGFVALLTALQTLPLTLDFFVVLPVAVILESIGRFLGGLDYTFKLRSHTVWEVTPSTKTLVSSQ